MEYKFRIYDKLNNKMISSENDEEEGYLFELYLDGSFSVFIKEEEGYECVDSEHFVLMQHIGRKDKNNKDIYVDDYVRCITNLYDISYDEILPIIWRENSLQFDTEHGVSLELLDQNEIEVVGNIYEDRGLLNE